MEPFIPEDLTGKTVLDVACNSGFFSIKMKERGAKHVLGIDVPGAIAQAKLVTEVHGADIELRAQNVYDFVLTNEIKFDFVLFLGLFYHLRHPLLVLDRLAELTNEKLLFQTQIFPPPAPGVEPFIPRDDYPITEISVFEQPQYPRMAFVEKNYNGEPTNWWMPNEACVLAMLRSAGLPSITPVTSSAGDRCFVCEPAEFPQHDDLYFWLSRRPSFPHPTRDDLP